MAKSDRESPLAKAIWYSFLDLICCSMGAALLMFLIVASAEQQVVAGGGRMLVVRAAHRDGFRGEIAIEFRTPDSPTWRRAPGASKTGKTWSFAARSQPDSGGEAVVIITDPAAGKWQFRAYLVDFPAPGAAQQFVALELQNFGDGKVVVNPGRQQLIWPGQATPALEIEIGQLK